MFIEAELKTSTLEFSSQDSSRKGATPWTVSLRLVAWAYILTAFIKHGIYRPLFIHGVDYGKHWEAARAVLEGRNNYLGGELWLGFNYPQWSALITIWLGWFSYERAELVWKAFHFCALVGAWWIARGLLNPGIIHGSCQIKPVPQWRSVIGAGLQRNWGLVSALLLMFFSPISASSLYIGQIEPLNALLIMAFVGALLIARFRLAGAYWAMLCLVKMMPVFLVVPLVLWRQWRVLQGWLAFMIGYLMILLITGRVGYEWFFVHDMMGKIPFAWREISISIPRLVMLAASPKGWHEDPWLYSRGVNIFLCVIVGLYLALMSFLSYHRTPLLRVLESALLLIPLISPLFEPHHMVWALPVLYLQVGRWIRGEMPSTTAALYVLGWGIVCLDFFYFDFLQSYGVFAQSAVLIGALWLLIVSVFEALKSAVPINLLKAS